VNPGKHHADFLRSVLSAGGTVREARFSLHRGLLRAPTPTFYLTLEQRGVASLFERPWSSELEELLLFERPTPMSDEHDEAERFAAILLNNLATAAQQHGRDLAEAVFTELVRERCPGLHEVLDRCPTSRPAPDATGYGHARGFLDHSLTGLRNTAELMLKLRPDQAEGVMMEALRIVLDETFSISDRDVLWPRPSAPTAAER
jgi:hypothetical protein